MTRRLRSIANRTYRRKVYSTTIQVLTAKRMAFDLAVEICNHGSIVARQAEHIYQTSKIEGK